MSVRRLYVEKREPYRQEAAALARQLRELPRMESLKGLRVLNRYDVEGLGEAEFKASVPVVFSEPQVDRVYDELPEWDGAVFAVEALPGQFDQRADSCAECIQLLCGGERPAVSAAKVYLLEGALSEEQLSRVKAYIVNPIETHETGLAPRETLASPTEPAPDVEILRGFTELEGDALDEWVKARGFAMDTDDILLCRQYFREEKRPPTLTELRMIDAYWSDHCRHTTFHTVLDELGFEHPKARAAFERYLSIRREMGLDGSRVTLMDMATIGARKLKRDGKLADLDESEEINACSVKIDAVVDGRPEPWLLMFKNETHNHPTEIEPFGGAATCVGGAIRDPLSGRGYVFGAVRVTGAGDPTSSETLPGKLPQRKICVMAAAGFSSYGNQIGLATGLVDEMYHPGYVAKRLEIGAVLGAAPASHVRRERPAPGDVVVLVGGRTGRDGVGGATGSSKAHSIESLAVCGAEVQKGNAPAERKLQRLFRDPKTARLIKRCNDFGAGGVSVAIGELADGLIIDLDAVLKKYDGLDGTELALSESQERMAVALASEDAALFMEKAKAENLEAAVVAEVTERPRLVMRWRGKTVCDISRDFLNTNGSEKRARAFVGAPLPEKREAAGNTLRERLAAHMADLNLCGKRGLVECFDSTIGAGTVLMPYGGRYQDTPAQALVMKLPVSGETTTCAGMSYACDPALLARDPYLGAYTAVRESVRKLIAAGFTRSKMWLTFQEYFERLRGEPARWGKPAAALLGALDAQLDLGVAAIGGKDSMSGSFENLDVPPTLCSFAVGAAEVDGVISPELKRTGSHLTWVEDMEAAERLIAEKRVLSCWAVGAGGLAEGLCKMAFGNRIGVRVTADLDLFVRRDGFIIETETACMEGVALGVTTGHPAFEAEGESVALEEIYAAYSARLESVYPVADGGDASIPALKSNAAPAVRTGGRVTRPKALIPVFPGTNCEYDTARALKKAGAEPVILVVNNLTPSAVGDSVILMEKEIRASQMIVLPGGFSGGDEPDGAGKFIVSFFRNPRVQEAVNGLLYVRDGLMLGICNGFQALVKLGLVPFGEIRGAEAHTPTLTRNGIGRHQSRLIQTRIVSRLSPWFSLCETGEIHTVAVSHGEGRFVCGEELLCDMAEKGQIVAQYVDLDGNPASQTPHNPNGSVWAIEGVSSPDGRVLGKMGHSERAGYGLYKNVPGQFDQKLFAGGTRYFS
ncbi:MAG: phosphoribosylformylglycinamidine synthase [Oscillospiraceae bacterium]|nr:phosphoribosylformylglycinamidine synthase [Oscillospiraceae bacterium]